MEGTYLLLVLRTSAGGRDRCGVHFRLRDFHCCKRLRICWNVVGDFSRRSLFRASLRARRFSGLPDLFLFFDVRVDPSEF